MTTNRTVTETKRAKAKGVRQTDVTAFQRLTFLASFPPIQSAIKVGNEGMRIQFDVPETEMGNAVGLLAMREKVLKITVEIADVQPKAKPVGDFQAGS